MVFLVLKSKKTLNKIKTLNSLYQHLIVVATWMTASKPFCNECKIYDTLVGARIIWQANLTTFDNTLQWDFWAFTRPPLFVFGLRLFLRQLLKGLKISTTIYKNIWSSGAMMKP
jgi:hypothetical protein